MTLGVIGSTSDLLRVTGSDWLPGTGIWKLTVYLYASSYRVLINDVLQFAGNNASYLTNTCFGLGSHLPGGTFSDISIQAATGWKRITYLGDSITAFQGYSQMVAYTYNTHKAHAINRSQSGAAMRWGDLDRQAKVAVKDNADIIIIAMGTNDLADYADATTIYERSLNALKISNPNAKIYGMGILPKKWAPNPMLTPTNLSIQTACENAGVPFWDTSGWIDPIADTVDGIHPNEDGSKKIVAEVLKRLPK